MVGLGGFAASWDSSLRDLSHSLRSWGTAFQVIGHFSAGGSPLEIVVAIDVSET